MMCKVIRVYEHCDYVHSICTSLPFVMVKRERKRTLERSMSIQNTEQPDFEEKKPHFMGSSTRIAVVFFYYFKL